MEHYFVIYNSDGDTHILPLTKEQVINDLNDMAFGPVGVLDKIPSETDTNYWGDNILIIKGKIVTPKPRMVVETYDIE